MTETDARQRFVTINAPGWLAARRYGMPSRMVHDATQRRLVGDWRGACRAAKVDISFSLDEVRRAYGTEVLARLGDDLLHFAPDLLRWHAPRHVRGGLGLLSDGRTLVLAQYGDGTGAPRLTAHTPAHYERPQRLELRLGPARSRPVSRRGAWLTDDDWTQARYLWDARAAGGLRFRLGGGDRTPFFHRDGRRLSAWELSAARDDDPVALTERVILLQDDGEIEAAWRAGGVQILTALPETQRWRNPDHIMPETFSAMVPALVRAARAAFAQPQAPQALVVVPQYGWGSALLVLVPQDDGLLARRSALHDVDLPALPRVQWQRFPDLELLRTGALTAGQLHPLVRAALFPDQPDPGYQPLPLPTVDSHDVRVRCQAQWHRVGWRDGRTRYLDHTEEEAAREQVMRSLGGPVPACFTVTDTWRGKLTDRLPGPLRRLRSHAMRTVMHGRSDELRRLLDAGVDPVGIVDRWASNPLDHLAKFGSGSSLAGAEPEPDDSLRKLREWDDPLELLPLLLAAGLDINARNSKGRTPLGGVLFDGGSAALVRAMLDAGADPTAVDEMRNSTLHLLRSAEADAIVPWLVAAGVSLDATNEYGRTPLLTQILAMAPAATIRATLAAGADIKLKGEYDDLSVVEAIEEVERHDLDFLVDAARAGGVSSDQDEDD